MDSVGRKLVVVTTSVDKQDANHILIPSGTRVKGIKRDDDERIYEITSEDGKKNLFNVLRGDEYLHDPTTLTILREWPAPPRPRSNNPIVCIEIIEDGLVTTRGWPHSPIPVGTRLQGNINVDGIVEDAENADGTLYINKVFSSQYKINTGSCSISGGRSKRKRNKKTKRRYTRQKYRRI